MDLFEAQRLAQRLMRSHGLIKRGWTFAFNRRKRSLGLCIYGDRRIELSAWFVVQNDEASVRDTVLHEIAHALAGHKAGHGPTWVGLCQQLGAEPKRICTSAVMPQGSYQAKCGTCGQVHNRYRRPMRNRTYYCGTCGPQRGKLRFMTPQ